MSGDLATLSIGVDSTSARTADKDLQGLGKTAGWLEGVVKKMAAAWGAWKVGQYIQDATLLAARYETLGVVMGVVGNNAGYTRAEMERYAQSLQKAGISMVESRNTLAIMAQAHIDLSKATDLARLAQDAAVVGNINSSEAFQRMIYGIQSGQTDVLRTIGINVNFEQSYDKLARTLGKTTKELTEAEKTMARTNAVMEKAPALAGAYEASMGTAGKQLLSMKRYAEDLMVVLGNLFGGALKVGVEAVNDALKGMKKWLEENAVAASLVKDNLAGAAENFVGLVKDSLSLGDGLRDVTEGLSLMEIGAGAVGLVFAFLRDATNVIVGGFRELVGLTGKVGQFFVQTFNLPAPEWWKKWVDWQAGQFEGGKAQFNKGFNASAINEFFNGKAETPTALASVSGNENASGRSVNVERILEQQRILAAKAKGTAGGAGGDSDKARKKQQEWDDLARAAMDYANALKMARQEYEMVMSGETESQAQDARDAAAYAKKYMDERSDYFFEKSQEMKRYNSEVFGDMTDVMRNWAGETKDALTDFITTGKADFHSMIDAWIMDLARMAAQNGLKDLAGSMKGSGTSWISTLGSLFGGAFADGGSPPMGKVSLVGERGPELFVPKTAGTVVPAGGFGGVQSTVNVSVSNSGVQSDAKGSTGMARDIEAAVLEVIHKHKRQGGELA